MTQITLAESKQTEALLRYLETLDFVKIEPEITSRTLKPKAVKATQGMRDFLETLPNGKAKQAGINKAVKEIRKVIDCDITIWNK